MFDSRPSKSRRLALTELEPRETPAAGALDLSFGPDGRVITDFGGYEHAGDGAVQPDGKIVVVGTTGNPGGDNSIALARHTADGALDPSFGTGGKVIDTFGGDNATGRAVAVQPDGKIVVVGAVFTGAADSEIAVARYNADGTPDTTFDGDGRFRTTVAGMSGHAESVAVLADGRIVIAGYATFDDVDPARFFVARLTAAGAFDNTFSTDGVAFADFGPHGEHAEDVAVQPDGKVVALGYANTGDGVATDFALARFNADGALDATFDGDGTATASFGDGFDIGIGVGLQPDGRILAVGYANSGAGTAAAVARFLPDGRLDPSFDGDGRLPVHYDGFTDDLARAVAVQPDGRIVVGGYTRTGADQSFALTRYHPDGRPDATFGGDGRVATSFGPDTFATVTGVVVQADGKIVAVGERVDSGGDFALMRYLPDGRLADATGSVVTPIGAATITIVRGTAVQPDGKIVAVGEAGSGGGSDFAVARYAADGSLDSSFGGGDGLVVSDLGTGDGTPYAVAVQPDGKIIVAGGDRIGGGYDFVVARYAADGTLDSSFGGGDGLVITDFGSDTDVAHALALQPDGKIVVAGFATVGGNRDIAAARYTVDGALDTTFSGDGKVTTAVGSTDDTGWGVAVQPDGKIVVAGDSYVSVSDRALTLVRYTADGVLDTTFDTDGKVTTTVIAPTSSANAVVLQPDGKIVAAGQAVAGANTDFAVARYTTTGALDVTFDGDGYRTTTFATAAGADLAQAVALQPDGKIVAAGYATINGATDFALARYHADGSPDATFDGDGKLTASLSTSHDFANAVAVQPDGKIVAAGRAFAGGKDQFAVLRFRGDNRAPLPVPTTLSVVEDESIFIFAPTYASDPDSDVLEITPLDGPRHGRLRLAARGKFEYIPDANFTGTDGFSYSADDGFGGVASGGVSFQVSSVNDSPTLADDAVLPAVVQGETNPAGRKLSSLFAGLVADPDGDGLGFGVTDNPATGEQGAWQYSTDGGVAWFDVGPVTAAAALALDQSAHVRFLAAPWFSGVVPPLTVRAADAFPGFITSGDVRDHLDTTVNGGTSPVSAESARVLTSVFPNPVGGAWLSPGGNLIVEGTNGNDVIAVKPNKTPTLLDVFLNRELIGQFPLASVTGQVKANGLAGSDNISLDAKLNKPALLDGGAGNDTLTGGAGADRLTGGAGNDSLAGGAGDDVYAFAGTWGADKVTEKAGTDRLDFSAVTAGVAFTKAASLTAVSGLNSVSAAGIETVTGGSGANTLTAATGNNVFTLTGANAGAVSGLTFTGVQSLVGGSGADTLKLTPGLTFAGTFNGGGGKNTLDYSAFTTAVTVDLGQGVIPGVGGATNVLNVTGGAGDDLLVGGLGANALSGGGGRDVLIGGNGADTLTGGADDDLMLAGFSIFDLVPGLPGLVAIQAVWTGADDYATRFTKITTGTGLPPDVVWNPTTHSDDGAKDSLAGGTGQDAFFASAGDILKDRVTTGLTKEELFLR